MYKIYILKLKDGSYYIGSTKNLKERLEYHNNKRARSTKNNLPFELIYTELFNSRSEAQTREYQIKKWKSRQAIERLINQKNMASSSNG